MSNQTLELSIDNYFSQVAKLNGVASAVRKFSVVPAVQQTMEKRIQQSSAFLSSINVRGVNEMQGEKLGIGVSNRITSNTDTSGGASRSPKTVHDMDKNAYLCRKNNCDTALRYATLDAWVDQPNFQELVRDAIIEAQALDRICIGFNGTSYAATSNPNANPLLQDVNIGWLQAIREDAADRVMDEVVEGSGVINVYAGGDYENLDALVMDAVNNLIHERHVSRTDLVAIVNRNMLSDKYFPLVNKDQPNSEKIAADMIISQKRLGGLQSVSAPFVPDGTILITTLDNLSIYWQKNGRRRHLKDNPERDQIENYESSNDAYVVEDYTRACLIENINTTAPVTP